MPSVPPDAGRADARIVVWFDHPRDCLCFATRVGLEPGQDIPDGRIVRIPLKLGEDFLDAVMNAATSAAIMGAGTKDYDNVMYGVQMLLDQRMVRAIEIAEEFRAQRRKNAGGGVVDKANEMVGVCASEFARLERLREWVVGEFKGPEVRDNTQIVVDLDEWLAENGFYES
jgi:hypothetical protein